MLTHDDVLDEFRAAGALLEGHFILSSGLHSSRYLQCARVLMDPQARRAALRFAGGDGQVEGAVKRASISSLRQPWGASSSATKWAGSWACPRSSSSGWTASWCCAAASPSTKGRTGADGGGHRHDRPVVARVHRWDRGRGWRDGRRCLPCRPVGRQGRSRRAARSADRSSKSRPMPPAICRRSWPPSPQSSPGAGGSNDRRPRQ